MLAVMVENGPNPAVHGVIRWRIIDLCQWIWEEYQISVSKQTLSRKLRALSPPRRNSVSVSVCTKLPSAVGPLCAHQVGFHEPRRRIVPIGKRANWHAAPYCR